MNRDFSTNYFALFDLPVRFAIDMARLDATYRDVQSQVHPDRFAAATEAERRRSMQWATYANEAYQTLRKPLSRARYLVRLAGVDTNEEINTDMPAEFLLQQMEWREAVADAKAGRNAGSLESLAEQLDHEQGELLAQLERSLDVDHDPPGGASLVRKLRFLEKLREEIGDALEHIEG
jgi:molecular chaperone HscB